MIVRCIDNLFQTDVLIEDREYEVRSERDDCYILSGFDKGFSKTRFEVVRACRSPSREMRPAVTADFRSDLPVKEPPTKTSAAPS